jgi:DNA processing protein
MKEIKRISIKDKSYPELLKKISDPPEFLYLRGEISAEEHCFAIVGTRRCSTYGKEVAFEITSALADAGLIIVSGLAPGIDTCVHLATVEREKRTIAVLGTGLDEKSIYPRSNVDLSRRILKTGGSLISEYPPGTPGSKFTFPKRNRIISGLSRGVLVVEAKSKSGALITADWARKQGKKIFAIPGPIHSLNSKGPHLLIKKGARLVEDANDILEALDVLIKRRISTLAGEDGSEEQLILNILKGGALEKDNIIEKTKLPAKKVSALLAVLEIKGRIRNLGGNNFILRR